MTRSTPARVGQCVATIALAIAAGACLPHDVRPGVVKHESIGQIRKRFRGPDVSVVARTVMNGPVRQIQPNISVGERAYVVVGVIDNDGTLTILYPKGPSDSGIVADKSKFVAPAFTPRRFVPTRSFFARGSPDGFYAGGHIFVIASLIPLKLDRLAENGRWSTFDVYFYEHEDDPEPAVTDLAVAISTDVATLSVATAEYFQASASTRLATPSTTPGQRGPP